MPGLSISRALPFTRGDQSISIWLDGKVLGTLPTDGPLLKDISAGAHEVQAWMNGSSGKKISVHVEEGETVELIVSKTNMPAGSWWEVVAFLLIIIIPGPALSGKAEWIKNGAFILLLAYSIFSWFRRKRGFLKLETVKSVEAAEAV